MTLRRILGGLDLVDLIDLDVEGAELVVLTSAIEEVNQKVKRVHVGTLAPDIEQGLRSLFWKHGWYKRNDYTVGRAELTEWGEIYFGNGVQTWINPRLFPVQPTSVELGSLQWAIRSSDFRYGNLQDEVDKLKSELDNARHEASAFENEAARLGQQLSDRERQVAGLRQQLEGWQKHWQSVENSAAADLRVRDWPSPSCASVTMPLAALVLPHQFQ